MARIKTKLALTSAVTAAALAVGLTAPAQASAAGLPPLPIAADVTAIVNCTIALVEQLVLGGRPGSDCFGVP
jgi:hypothetical protein